MSIPEAWYGHTPEPVEVVTYKCVDCGRELKRLPDGTYVHEQRVNSYNRDRDDYTQFYRQQRDAAKAKRLAEAMPYKGAIKQCQASVWPNERAPLPHRCNKPAKFVVSRNPYWDGKVASTGTEVDRIAVCRVHAEDMGSHRFHAHRWGKLEGPVQGDALELVEVEYR